MPGDRVMSNIVPVILCGGSGTRLWPLSRRAFPKQFAVEFDHASLLDLTLRRCAGLRDVSGCIAVTGEDYRFMVREAMEREGLAGDILLEPEARNTAPALCAAALHIESTFCDAMMLVLPSDHFIPDIDAFAAALVPAVELARDGWWVTLGISPDKPSTAYGYIQPGDAIKGLGGQQVTRFLEKPDADTARRLIEQGCLWNAGIFVVKASVAAAMIAHHAPGVHEPVATAVARLAADQVFRRLDPASFAGATSISIDYAVLEKEARVAVVPYPGAWTDLGSWDAVATVHAPDACGNRSEGDAIFNDCHNSFVYSPGKLTVALGLDDVVVIDTPDALLVTTRDKAEQVKHVVDDLKARERPEVSDHRKVARPWGAFEEIDRGERYQVKRITVKPGAQLSLQYHHHRAEHWIVVKGTARVTRGDEVFLLRENESTYIPLGSVHRLENPGKADLELIEVQSGSYLGEDDIVRVEDVYGRGIEPAGRVIALKPGDKR